MKEKQFKGFEDLKVMRDGSDTFWAFKGENVWSKDIVELWKWVQLARKKSKGMQVMPWDIKIDLSDFEEDD